MLLAIIASTLVLAGCGRLCRRQPRWTRDVSPGVAGIVVATPSLETSIACGAR
jgi:hypothetical protein